jgi:YebC/PmpR family DNA-binding regulatory protein
MPNDNIKKAIDKAKSATQGADYAEVTYEGYGPGGAAILIDALTDNKNRTASEVRHVFSKHGGNLGSTNCVAWMFERKGYIAVKREASDEDTLMEIILEAGADDLTDSDDYWEITCPPESFEDVIKALEEAEIKTEEANIAKLPENSTAVNEKDLEKLMIILEALEDLDDVQNVWTNFDSD